MTPIKLVSGFLTVGGWTLASRGVGFIRDVMMAAYLGTGPMAEAFLIAFSLPNMFRRFFAEGAFNMAFVPLFAKKLEAGDDPHGFARDAFSALGAILIVFTIIGTIAMPALVWAMASGFVGDARFDLAVEYGRISFVYILFISLVALLSGVLTTLGHFTEASFVPVLLNLIFIAAMLIAGYMGWDMGITLAWTVPVTGVAQFAFAWFWARKAGFALTPRWPRVTPELKRLAYIAAPAVLAGGVVQINLLVGRQVASFTEGAVAWLSYADRLYQLPLGVVGIAIGTVLLPDLSRRLRAGDEAGGQNSYNRGTEFALALTIPSAVALVVIANPLISVLFERGAFDVSDTNPTALALAIYGIGLPAFVLQKVLQPLYYAREDSRRPFYFAVMSMIVNLAIAVGLLPIIGFAAAAWATTLSGWVMALQLWNGARKMGQAAQFDARLRRRTPRIIAAALLMGATLFGMSVLLDPALHTPGWRYGALLMLIASGAISYFGFGSAIGAFAMSDFTGSLRRKRG
ncbi:murein biosynthesis integral membrane protein MurJ [Pseudorhodobacter sp. W20_MBD10_FR17]|uniref:murein biosynthesis integral membrane protein MurJ n=1 Tax=Pseudorhodobacter sp. W20_MBD10_FR17 TaxID=3240266 RepID=UPI003F989254